MITGIPRPRWSRGRSLLVLVLSAALSAVLLFVPSVEEAQGTSAEQRTLTKPVVSRAVKHDRSPPLRSIRRPSTQPQTVQAQAGEPREVRRFPSPKVKEGTGARADSSAVRVRDRALQESSGGGQMPEPLISFNGIGNSDNLSVLGLQVLPADPNGDIGPNHYVQMNNLVLAVYDRTGRALLGPIANNALFAGFGGVCETTNEGDPIVLYDPLADRWLLGQFAFATLPNGDPAGPYFECVAISQTPDPTGAYFRYAFQTSASKLPDYPKIGVWPDGYYFTANQFLEPAFTFTGATVGVFEREKMLLGQSAQVVFFDLEPVNPNFANLLPSDLDGLPPPDGAPNYVAEVDDTMFGFATDRLQVFELQVDWSTPANSTFTGPTVLNVAPFDPDLCNFQRSCIPQPDTLVGLDPIPDRLLHRLQYRNFGTHETLVSNHTVDVDGSDHAGIRWYELRKTNGPWVIHQQGTYAPDDDHRWMGSAALDKDGNLAIGYSVSGPETSPSVRYAGRLANDPLGTLLRGEQTLHNGSGSQTSFQSRWGDYSMLAVDPKDDCTFWYTNEYYDKTSAADWETRIGAFQHSVCNLPRVEIDDFFYQVDGGGTKFKCAAPPGTCPGGTSASVIVNTSHTYRVRLGVTTEGGEGLKKLEIEGPVTLPPSGGGAAAVLPADCGTAKIKKDKLKAKLKNLDPGESCAVELIITGLTFSQTGQQNLTGTWVLTPKPEDVQSVPALGGLLVQVKP